MGTKKLKKIYFFRTKFWKNNFWKNVFFYWRKQILKILFSLVSRDGELLNNFSRHFLQKPEHILKNALFPLNGKNNFFDIEKKPRGQHLFFVVDKIARRRVVNMYWCSSWIPGRTFKFTLRQELCVFVLKINSYGKILSYICG